MKLRELIEHLKTLCLADDDWTTRSILDCEVEFDTTDRQNLTLLSVYYHDGMIRIDIGEESK